MKMVSKVFVFALIVSTASAATWIGLLPQKPSEFSDKQGCFVQEINDVVPFGSVVTPVGVCYNIQCSTSAIEYASCGVVATDDPKCHVTDVDLSKPYPYCCPDVRCELDNNLS